MVEMPRRAVVACFSMLRCLVLLLAAAGLLCAADEPRFTEKNELVRPEGYRRWVFVGASLAMTYKEENPSPARNFHNVYLHPRAFDEFEKTGKFPENTILILETLTSASQASINRDGDFEDRFVGLSAAVKNSSRFKEGWAYFSFPAGQSKAAAFSKERCWSCHSQHGARDNVFLQFYPVLRALKAAQQ